MKWNHKSWKTCCKWFPQMKFKMSSINELRKLEELCFLWYDPLLLYFYVLLVSNDLCSIMFRASQKNWMFSDSLGNYKSIKVENQYVVRFRFLCGRISISWEVCFVWNFFVPAQRAKRTEYSLILSEIIRLKIEICKWFTMS